MSGKTKIPPFGRNGQRSIVLEKKNLEDHLLPVNGNRKEEALVGEQLYQRIREMLESGKRKKPCSSFRDRHQDGPKDRDWKGMAGLSAPFRKTRSFGTLSGLDPAQSSGGWKGGTTMSERDMVVHPMPV